jgi:hypothetical protein
MKAFAWKALGIIVILVFAALLETSRYTDRPTSEKTVNHPTIDQQMDAALSQLNESEVRNNPDKGVVLITRSGEKVPEDYFINTAHKQENYWGRSFLWSYGENRHITETAPGLDLNHHIVHSFLEGYKPFDTDNVWIPFWVLSKRKSYQYDHIQYHKRREVWQTSKQAYYYTRGDCEDHAIALADWLIELGEDARAVIGDWQGGGHVWVVLIKEDETFLLEATRKTSKRMGKYPLAKYTRGYRPEYMFNRHVFWKNSGSLNTTDYTGSHWQQKSNYFNSLADLQKGVIEYQNPD